MILLKCQYLHARYEFLPKLQNQNGDVGLPSAAHPGCLKDLTSQLLLQRVPDPQRSSCLLFHSCRNILKQPPFPECMHLFLTVAHHRFLCRGSQEHEVCQALQWVGAYFSAFGMLKHGVGLATLLLTPWLSYGSLGRWGDGHSVLLHKAQLQRGFAGKPAMGRGGNTKGKF